MITQVLRKFRWVALVRVAAVATVALVACVSVSRAGIIVTSDQPYGVNKEVFTVDPHAGVNANRGFDTTRKLRQSFKNPTTFDVHKIVASVDVNKITGGFILEFFEVADVNVTPIVLGNLVHTLTLPPNTYTNTSQRLGIVLNGSDIFTLPQRDAGTTGYALQISQVDTSITATGVWVFANTGADNYVNGKFYIESGAQSSASRDAGLALSSAPEPSTVCLALVGMAGVVGLWARRRGR